MHGGLELLEPNAAETQAGKDTPESQGSTHLRVRNSQQAYQTALRKAGRLEV